MRGVYDGNIKCAALNSARTLFYLTAPAGAVVEIISTDITDASNATNQQLEACWQRITTLGAPGSTPITPSKTEQGDQAAASTVAGNVTTAEPAYTTNTVIDQRGFPSLVGYHEAPDEKARIRIKPGESWGLRMLTPTPAALDVNVGVRFQEIG